MTKAKWRERSVLIMQLFLGTIFHKESCGQNGCFWAVELEKTFESPVVSKEIQPVNLRGSQAWIFNGRTDAEAEAPVPWPPDAKSWLIRKDPDAGKDWRREEKGKTEDEMVGWHHWLDGHEFEKAPGVGEGQGSLACCSPWGCKESDTTDQLNNPLLSLFPWETRPEVLPASLPLSSCIPAGPLRVLAHWSSQRACKQFTLN